MPSFVPLNTSSVRIAQLHRTAASRRSKSGHILLQISFPRCIMALRAIFKERRRKRMPEIFVEKRSEGNWHAIRNEKTIVTGATQNECGCNAKKKYPNEPLLTGRVEHAKRGNP